MFLDPIKLTHVDLVTYNEAGAMCPSPSAVTPEERSRVEVINRLLGLSAHQPLIEARQRIWSDCRSIIAQVETLKAEERQFAGSTSRTREAREILMKQLRQKARAREPFSSVAKACLTMSGHSWAIKIVEAI